MATPYCEIINAFLRRIELDRKFFNYLNMTPEQANEIARQRSMGLMNEAIGILVSYCSPEIDFADQDDEAGQFNVTLTAREKYLISSLMYQQYLERDIAKLKVLNVNYTPTELRVFDPSNARQTFMSIYQYVCDQNAQLMDEYRNRGRDDGQYLSIDFSAYDEADDE